MTVKHLKRFLTNLQQWSCPEWQLFVFDLRYVNCDW